MRKKVTVVGAGNVGATLAQRLAELDLADVVLVDVVEGVPQGKALDLLESGPVQGYDAHVLGTNDYGPTKGSDIVVITAGVARKPGMSRDDLLRTNAGIVTSCVKQAVAQSPNAILIIVSNPLDAMCYAALKTSKFPRERVIGMAGILDSARMRTFIADELHVSVENIQAFVLGGHGDTMVPLPRYSTVAGIPLPDLLTRDRIEAIVQRTRDGGAEIVKFLKTGSAYYAPSAATAEMVEAILKDKKKILPCCVWLQGEYGLKDVCVGVPVKLGEKGCEEIIEIKLESHETDSLKRSAEAVIQLQGAIAI